MNEVEPVSLHQRSQNNSYALSQMFKLRTSSLLLFSLFLCCLVTKIKAISFYCSANVYAIPNTQDCYRALEAFPTADGAHRYFLEPQMRLQMPNLNWPMWADPRLPSDNQRVEQIPKYWSSGIDIDCHISDCGLGSDDLSGRNM